MRLRTVPAVGETLLAAVLLVAALIAAMEILLAVRGIRPTAVDDEPTWVLQRYRAAALGPQALILIGASRIQTDIDIDALRDATHLEPVQLAIDGNSFVPILKGLADDTAVNGTILVSYGASALLATDGKDQASRYELAYESDRDRLNSVDFSSAEYRLDGLVRSRLRAFADGARPITSLTARIMTSTPSPQYSIFLLDRSRLADYANLDATEAYYTRVLRELGGNLTIPAGADLRSVDVDIRARIAASPEIPEQPYQEGLDRVAAYVHKIEARGGRVAFVDFPTNGLITEMEDHACPRERCWERFVAATPSATHLSFHDVAYLRTFPVPDGSHIDFRNRRQLTLALVQLLKLNEPNPINASPR